MARSSKVETYRAVLRARGVPERFVEALATRKGPPMRVLFSLALMFAGLMALMVADAWAGDPVSHWLASWFCRPAPGSLLIFTAEAPMAALFAMLAASIVPMFSIVTLVSGISSGRVKPAPAHDYKATSLRTLRPGETLETLRPDANYQNLAGLADDTAFLQAIRPTTKTPSWSYYYFALIIVAILAMGVSPLLSLGDYKEVTADAVYLHKSGKTRSYRLADAQYAYITCSTGDRYPRFDYRLVYPKLTISVWNWHDDVHRLSGGQVMQRLGQVDEALVANHVRIDRMPAGGPRDEAEACIAQFARTWSTADRRLMRRLVIGDVN